MVEWQGSVDPIYKEVGELDVFTTEIGRNSEEGELCIDIDDLIEWFKYRRL